MSWNWSVETEEKNYEVHGTVTISTEEYRDLIQSVCDLRTKGQREHDDWYKEYQRANELEKKLKTCEEKLSEFVNWFDSDDSLRPKFRLWKAEMLEQKESEE